MIKRMEEIGLELLEKSPFDRSEMLSGFHWPIVSVQHFHLHIIAPKLNMNWFKKIEFHSWGFGSVQAAIEKLKTKIEQIQQEGKNS